MDSITIVVEGVSNTAEFEVFDDNALQVYLPDGTVLRHLLDPRETARSRADNLIRGHLRQVKLDMARAKPPQG